MALIVADRVQETATSPGTGTVTLSGASTGYRTFSAAIGANNTTYYVIADQSGANWEVGLGTVGAGGTTLARTTVLASSNSGSLVNFSSGSQYVWCDYTAAKAVYADASGNISNLAGGISTANYVTFNTSPSVTPVAGQAFWNSTQQGLEIQMNANVAGTINQDGFIYVKASAAITKGQVCMFTGSVGASGVLTAAPATGVTDGTYIMGIADETIALNGFGFIQALGTLTGINTSAYSAGTILWYNPSVTGGLTSTKPSAPNLKVQMAAVINANSNGSIFIRIAAGSVLGGTDSNVQIGTPTMGQLLIYDATLGYWKNANADGLLWQSVQTSNFTAVANCAYPVNTTSGQITVTLPASPVAGQKVTIVDYAGTFQTNYCLIAGNGANVQGSSSTKALIQKREGISFVYVDSTQGWLAISNVVDSDVSVNYSVSYAMIAGGGAGGGNNSGNSAAGGGGGAGGYLTGTASIYKGLTYNIVVGAGGAGSTTTAGSAGNGNNTTFYGLTAIAGGGGGAFATDAASGGSGGGGRSNVVSGGAGGSGTSGQGNAGGAGGTASLGGAGGGGGGAGSTGAVGTNGNGGNGGNSVTETLTGTSIALGGGGGGGGQNAGGSAGTNGGAGAAPNSNGSNATANRGGGGGGYDTVSGTAYSGGNGGSGIVILSVPTANYSGTYTGTVTVTTNGSNTILRFTSSGSYTA